METRAKRVNNQIKENRKTLVTWLLLIFIAAAGMFIAEQIRLPAAFVVVFFVMFVGSFWVLLRMRSSTSEDLAVLHMSRALSALQEHKQDPSEEHLKESRKQLRDASSALNTSSTSSLRRQLRKRLREVAVSLRKMADADDISVLNSNIPNLRRLAKQLMNPRLDDLDNLDEFVSRTRQLHEKQGINLRILVQGVMGSTIGQIALSFVAGVVLFPLLAVVVLLMVSQDPIPFLHNNPTVLLTGVGGTFGVFVLYFSSKGRP